MKKTLLLIILSILGSHQITSSQVLLDNNNINATKYPENQKVFEIDLFTSPDKFWSNYDFIPGKNILFFDFLDNEKESEKPLKWKTLSGNATVKDFENKNVIDFETAKKTSIEPSLFSEEVLPRNFTLEFDLFFDKYANQSITEYWLYFNNDIDTRIEISSYSPLKISFKGENSPSVNRIFEYSSITNFHGWHHISLSYNFNTLKVYFDDILITNNYASSLRPEHVAVYANTYDYRANSNRKTLLKNFKISTGKSSIYSGIATNGKYSTNAIIFEKGKPFFNSPSSGELKRLYKFMHDNPNWNFNITAPNDNTIDLKHNFETSTKRSQCIKNTLVKLGISEKRLSIIGKKEATNMDYYDSIEKKKENQIVEFALRP